MALKRKVLWIVNINAEAVETAFAKHALARGADAVCIRTSSKRLPDAIARLKGIGFAVYAWRWPVRSTVPLGSNACPRWNPPNTARARRSSSSASAAARASFRDPVALAFVWRMPDARSVRASEGARGVPYRQPLDYGTHKIIAALARRRRHAPASPLLQLGFLIVARLQT